MDTNQKIETYRTKYFQFGKFLSKTSQISQKVFQNNNCNVLRGVYDRLYSDICIYQGSSMNLFFDYYSLVPVLCTLMAIVFGLAGIRYGTDSGTYNQHFENVSDESQFELDPEFAEYACVERQRLDRRSVEMMQHQIGDTSIQRDNLADHMRSLQRGNRKLSGQGVTYGDLEIQSPTKIR